MAKLIFLRRVATMEKGAKLEANTKSVVVVGVFLIVLLGAAIFLFLNDQKDAGRTVLELAVAFLAWVTGRATGEKAATESS